VRKYINKKCKVEEADDAFGDLLQKLTVITKGASECKDFAASNAMAIFEKVITELE
jgi:hypothetical protein